MCAHARHYKSLNRTSSPTLGEVSFNSVVCRNYNKTKGPTKERLLTDEAQRCEDLASGTQKMKKPGNECMESMICLMIRRCLVVNFNDEIHR